jgi:hypothetical protein
MKKYFTLIFFTLFILLSSSGLKAQNQVYWVEGFDVGATTISTVAPVVNAQAVGSWNLIGSGEWYVYGTYRTTGTTCANYGPNHLRMSKNILGGGASPGTDSAYFVTPTVAFGIQELHFTRNEATRKYDIYWRADTSAAATAGWNLVTSTPNSTTICADTTVIVAQPGAKRLMIRSGKAGVNYDIDSIWETSFSTIVPVIYSGINAIATNGAVKVTWDVQTEISTKEYVIERSANGSQFSPIGTLSANGSSKYTWIDNSPINGDGYYRVKGVDVNGAVSFTSIVTAGSGNNSQGIVVAPNPVKGGLVNLRLNNLAKGNYTVNVFSGSGEKVFSSSVSHGGGNSVQTLTLASSVSKGLYNVHVTNGVASFNKTIIVE